MAQELVCDDIDRCELPVAAIRQPIRSSLILLCSRDYKPRIRCRNDSRQKKANQRLSCPGPQGPEGTIRQIIPLANKGSLGSVEDINTAAVAQRFALAVVIFVLFGQEDPKLF